MSRKGDELHEEVFGHAHVTEIDSGKRSLRAELRELAPYAAWRQRVLDDYEGWLDPAPMAHLRLPVTVKPGWVQPATEGAS